MLLNRKQNACGCLSSFRVRALLKRVNKLGAVVADRLKALQFPGSLAASIISSDRLRLFRPSWELAVPAVAPLAPEPPAPGRRIRGCRLRSSMRGGLNTWNIVRCQVEVAVFVAHCVKVRSLDADVQPEYSRFVSCTLYSLDTGPPFRAKSPLQFAARFSSSLLRGRSMENHPPNGPFVAQSNYCHVVNRPQVSPAPARSLHSLSCCVERARRASIYRAQLFRPCHASKSRFCPRRCFRQRSKIALEPLYSPLSSRR